MANTVRLSRPSLVGAGPFGDWVVQILADRFTKGRAADPDDLAGAFSGEIDAVVLALWRHSPRLCEQADELAHRRGIPWLPITMESTVMRVGPWVAPGSGPCHRCYRLRRIQHDHDWEGSRAIYDAYDRDSTLGPVGFLPHHARLAASFAASLLCDPLPGRVITISAISLSVDAHHVVACHGCDRCLPRSITRDLHSLLQLEEA